MTAKIIGLSLMLIFANLHAAENRLMFQFIWAVDTDTFIPNSAKLTAYSNHLALGLMKIKKKSWTKPAFTAGLAKFNDRSFVEAGVAISSDIKPYTMMGILNRELAATVSSYGTDISLGLGIYRNFYKVSTPQIKPDQAQGKPYRNDDDDDDDDDEHEDRD